MDTPIESSLKYKDITHTQEQWEKVQEKLRERDLFEAAKCIIIKRTQYKFNYDYRHGHNNSVEPVYNEYLILNEDEYKRKLVELITTIETQDLRITDLNKTILDQGNTIYQLTQQTIKAKRFLGFLWRIN